MTNQTLTEEPSLEERRFQEEVRRAHVEEQLKRDELEVERRRLDSTRRDGLRQLYSPIGVAVLAGALGLAGNYFNGIQNRALEREKATAEQALERQRQEASLLLKLAEQSDNAQRANNLLFFAEGGYLHFTAEYKRYLRTAAGLTDSEAVRPPAFSSVVSIPGNPNEGLTHASQASLLELFGRPGSSTTGCGAVTSARLKPLIVTGRVDSLTFTGLKPAVEAVVRVLTAVKRDNPSLFAELQSYGMLCVRHLPGRTSFSSHAWGTAVDIGLRSGLRGYGGRTQQSQVLLAPYFKKEMFLWVVNPMEPGFHFEASHELLQEWNRQGLLSTTAVQ